MPALIWFPHSLLFLQLSEDPLQEPWHLAQPQAMSTEVKGKKALRDEAGDEKG